MIEQALVLEEMGGQPTRPVLRDGRAGRDDPDGRGDRAQLDAYLPASQTGS